MLAVSGSARGKLGGSDASHTSREPEGHLHEVKVPPQASDTGATWTMEAATRSADHSRCLPVLSRQQLRRAPSRWLRGSGHYLAGALRGTSAVASTETRRPRTLTVLLPSLTATYRNNKIIPWVPPHFSSIVLVPVAPNRTLSFSLPRRGQCHGHVIVYCVQPRCVFVRFTAIKEGLDCSAHLFSRPSPKRFQSESALL